MREFIDDDTPRLGHAVSAERALLASLLVDHDAVAEVSTRLTAESFTSATHRDIYRAILGCWEQRTPSDFVNVDAQLSLNQARNATVMDLSRLLDDAGQWSSTYVMYYVQRVENAQRFRIFEKSVQEGRNMMAANPDLDPVEVMQGIMGQVLSGMPTNSAPGLSTSDLAPALLQLIQDEAAGLIDLRPTPTGYRELNDVLQGGLKYGDLCILAARPSQGKSLALDTPIPTPAGWTTMGGLAVGDTVFGRDGQPCRVTMKTPIQHERECFTVRFDDGSEIVADADHRWLTSSRKDRKNGHFAERIVTTRDILVTLKSNDGRSNHSIRNTEAIDLPDVDLPISPYTLGAWLGDGSRGDGRICKPDPELFEGIAAEGYTVGPDTSSNDHCRSSTVYGLKVMLREYGLLKNKHVPDVYLRASRKQRMALLQGLMDTDGSILEGGYVEFVSTTRALAEGVVDLAQSLGYRVAMREDRAQLNGEDYGPRYRVNMRPLDQVFTIPRKRDRYQPPTPRQRSRYRYIVAVEAIESVPVACITVDSPDHMYLAGRAYIPTHNSALAMGMALGGCAFGQSMFFSLEMDVDSLMRRAVSALSSVPYDAIARALLTTEQMARVARALDKLKGMPLVIDDSAGLTTDQIKLRVQRQQALGPVSVVIVDYLELVGNVGENEERRLSRIATDLKNMSKELGIVTILLSQLSREVERRTPPIPRMSDLRYSGSLEAIADKIIFLYREDYYVQRGMVHDHERKESEGIAQLRIDKNRNGALGIARLRYHGPTMSFSSPVQDQRRDADQVVLIPG